MPRRRGRPRSRVALRLRAPGAKRPPNDQTVVSNSPTCTGLANTDLPRPSAEKDILQLARAAVHETAPRTEDAARMEVMLATGTPMRNEAMRKLALGRLFLLWTPWRNPGPAGVADVQGRPGRLRRRRMDETALRPHKDERGEACVEASYDGTSRSRALRWTRLFTRTRDGKYALDRKTPGGRFDTRVLRGTAQPDCTASTPRYDQARALSEPAVGRSMFITSVPEVFSRSDLLEFWI